MLRKAFAMTLVLSIFAAGCQAHPSAADAASGESKTVTVDKNGDSVAMAASLVDLSSHWARDSILNAIKKGYVDGYEDGTFRPDNNISRAEFIKMLVVATKEKLGGQTGQGVGAAWYEPFINSVRDSGVYHDDDFPADKLDDSLTRIEMAKLAVRYLVVDSRPKAAQFLDDAVMYRATKLGVIQGLAGGELGPDKTTTRAQAVTIIERILTAKAGGTLPVDKYAVSAAELALKRTNIFSVMPEVFGGKQFENETEHAWNPNNLVMETPDGNFKGAIDQVVAIDMEDPNDPNLALLGDIDTLKWNNFSYPNKDKEVYVKDYPKSYIILFQSHNDFNHDPDTYNSASGVHSSIKGLMSKDISKMMKGRLNGLAVVYKKIPGDMNAFILPKSGYSLNNIVYIDISAPARPPHDDYTKNILAVSTLED
jgi:hypothetical protein